MENEIAVGEPRLGFRASLCIRLFSSIVSIGPMQGTIGEL